MFTLLVGFSKEFIRLVLGAGSFFEFLLLQGAVFRSKDFKLSKVESLSCKQERFAFKAERLAFRAESRAAGRMFRRLDVKPRPQQNVEIHSDKMRS